jgi:CheY-like chemotaxis protein
VPARILIADPDESFGLMLKQILELSDEYTADAAQTGARALELAQKRRPDLAIVDAALADMSPAALITSLQLILPGVPIMLIPMGTTLPDEYRQMGVRTILTKPFFVGDLARNLEETLGAGAKSAEPPSSDSRRRPLVPAHRLRGATRASQPAAGTAHSEPASDRKTRTSAGSDEVPSTDPAGEESSNTAASLTSQQSPETVAARLSTWVGRLQPDARPAFPAGQPIRAAPTSRVRQSLPLPERRGSGLAATEGSATSGGNELDAALERALTTLTHELRADAVFILKEGVLLAQRGSVGETRSEKLAEILQRWSTAAIELAALVGERNAHFGQFHAEGERYHVYSYEGAKSILLVIICRTDIPFGTLRLNLKSAGAELAKAVR